MSDQYIPDSEQGDILLSLKELSQKTIPHAPTFKAAVREIEALRAENARLREALKPFADEASVGPMPGEPHDPRKCSMKFLLAARKALGESDGL